MTGSAELLRHWQALNCTHLLGLPHIHYRTADSTNARALELAELGAPAGTLVTAAEQTAGRGRQGREWQAPAGKALLCSLILERPPQLLPLLAGIAIAEVVESVAEPTESVLLKWPNDVILGGGKVAGSLIQGRPQEAWTVLGIGVNVAFSPRELPAEIGRHAASLELERASIEVVQRRLLERLGHWLGQSTTNVLAAFRQRDTLLDQDVRWAGGSGVASGIDDSGALTVKLSGGEEVSLQSGEVHLEG